MINAVVSQDEGLQFDPIIWPEPFCVQFAWVLSSYSDLRVMSLHLAVNLLYLLICSLLFMVDLDMDTHTPWGVLFTWMAVVKGFLFIMKMIL